MIAQMIYLKYLRLYILLVVFFCILSASVSIISMFVFIFFAGISIFILSKIEFPYIKLPRCKILKLVKYLPWLLKEILIASLDTILVIVNIKKINPVIIKQPVIGDEMVDTIYANSVTLTPGTLTMALSSKEIQTHALNKDFMEGLLQSAMYKKVKDIGYD